VGDVAKSRVRIRGAEGSLVAKRRTTKEIEANATNRKEERTDSSVLVRRKRMTANRSRKNRAGRLDLVAVPKNSWKKGTASARPKGREESNKKFSIRRRRGRKGKKEPGKVGAQTLEYAHWVGREKENGPPRRKGESMESGRPAGGGEVRTSNLANNIHN